MAIADSRVNTNLAGIDAGEVVQTDVSIAVRSLSVKENTLLPPRELDHTESYLRWPASRSLGVNLSELRLGLGYDLLNSLTLDSFGEHIDDDVLGLRQSSLLAKRSREPRRA